MGPHVPNVTSLCLQYMKHDPNYNHDSDEDEEQMETEDSDFSEQGGWTACCGYWRWRGAWPSQDTPAKDGIYLGPCNGRLI